MSNLYFIRFQLFWFCWDRLGGIQHEFCEEEAILYGLLFYQTANIVILPEFCFILHKIRKILPKISMILPKNFIIFLLTINSKINTENRCPP